MLGIKKEIWVSAGIAVAAYAAVAFFQRTVAPIPVVGQYLPK